MHTNNRFDGKYLENSIYIQKLWSNSIRQNHCTYCRQVLKSIIDCRPEVSDAEVFSKIIMNGEVVPDDTFPNKFDRIDGGMSRTFEHYCKVCIRCGWWFGFKNTLTGNNMLTTYGGIAGLREFDISDAQAPIDEVRDYLMTSYHRIKNINPRVFEHVVADVFKNLGYRTRVTGYSGDNGIDVILDGDNGTVIGVQVKRYKNLIKVDKIRELTGALVINGMTSGIFITTSDFQSGAPETAAMSAAKGYPIKLMNAEDFFDALSLSQVKKFSDYEERLANIHMKIIEKRGI